MLIIDNYDSFTYNIVQYLKIIGINPIVIENDKMSIKEVQKLNFSKIILSPGWGNPDNSGITMEIIDFYQDKLPILGVCLGMQCIAKYFGADIVKAPEPYHGKNSKIFFDNEFELFRGLKQGFSATRYHSLIVTNLPNNVIMQAWTEDKILMGIKIKGKKIFGVQFHPEAILTENGIEIFKNFSINVK